MATLQRFLRHFLFWLHLNVMRHYERRLPHWDVVGHPLFVTFRLHGSLPVARVFPPSSVDSGKVFAVVDRILDSARSGPTFLKQPRIAEMLVEAVRDGQQKLDRYTLHSFVVMPNHVHLLVTPAVAATEWLGPLKGFTARCANKILGRCGVAFWQNESYDHLVRSEEEFGRIRRYIELNPVKAGLAATADEFPWSSARAG